MSKDRNILQDFPLAENPEQAAQTSNLVEDFTRFREAPIESLRTLLKHITGSSWRSYDNYIGQQLYTQGVTEFLNNKLLQTLLFKRKLTNWLMHNSI